MATTVTYSPTSTYAGTASPFFAKSIIDSKTYNTAGIQTKNDVEYKYTLRGFDLDDSIQTGETCSWNATGTLTITEGTLEVKPFYQQITLCPKDFKADWNFESSTEIPSDIQDEIFDLLGKRIKAKTDADAWKSSTSTGLSYTLGQFDGYLKQLNGTAIEITGVTLTSSNIAAQISRVISAQDAALLSTDASEKVIFVSHAAEALYKQNLQTQGINTTNGVYPSDHSGIEVRGVSLPANVMVLGLRSSFHFVSNVDLDKAAISIVNLFPTTAVKEVRVATHYSYNVGVTNKDQVVLYNY